MKKAIVIVLDSLGVGELPDAGAYGDSGSATVQHILEACPDLELKNLRRLGLFNIDGMTPGREYPQPEGVYCRAKELSKGKDSIVGHWELMGLITEKPFETFPDGFPSHVIEDFEAMIGRKTLANISISGTEVINIYGAEHLRMGSPIVYTSADSVFQIAAHEDVIQLDTLYEYCLMARAYFDGSIGIGRVIARPFTGEPGNFTRTANRHDFAALPAGDSVIQILQSQGVHTFSVGKPMDIFSGLGFDSGIATYGNADGIAKLIQAARERDGFIFANLIDFDQQYGHRRDPQGYADALAEFDRALPEIIKAVGDGLLIITADHGNDPTFTGSDHTREYVPILVRHTGIEARNAGTRETFADAGATVMDWFGVDYHGVGRSILN